MKSAIGLSALLLIVALGLCSSPENKPQTDEGKCAVKWLKKHVGSFRFVSEGERKKISFGNVQAHHIARLQEDKVAVNLLPYLGKNWTGIGLTYDVDGKELSDFFLTSDCQVAGKVNFDTFTTEFAELSEYGQKKAKNR